MPDDGTGALPLLRHIILNDDKSSTYKLALLRVLCRIADSAAGLARHPDDDHVAVPMGLVALTWLRLFKPLLEADFPQSPGNRRGGDGLGFAKTALKRLRTDLPHHDLRVGMRFSGDIGKALHEAMRDAAHTIATMPATYLTYPNGGKILPVVKDRTIRRSARVLLEHQYLTGFGTMHVPMHLWTALQRYSVWIEPALQAEWIRLTKRYAERQGATDRRCSIGGGDDVVRSRSRRQRGTPGGGTPPRDGRPHLRLERQAPVGGSFRHRSLLPLGHLAVRGPVEPHARPPADQPAREA